jgi:hypothetical protein
VDRLLRVDFARPPSPDMTAISAIGTLRGCRESTFSRRSRQRPWTPPLGGLQTRCKPPTTSLKRLKCANTGHSPTARRMCQKREGNGSSGKQWSRRKTTQQPQSLRWFFSQLSVLLLRKTFLISGLFVLGYIFDANDE